MGDGNVCICNYRTFQTKLDDPAVHQGSCVTEQGQWSCFAEIVRAVSGKGIEREYCKDTLTQGPNVPRVQCWFTPDKSLHPYSETNVGVAVLGVSWKFP